MFPPNCKGNSPYSALDTAGLIGYVMCVEFYVFALSLCLEGCRKIFLCPTSGVLSLPLLIPVGMGINLVHVLGWLPGWLWGSKPPRVSFS